MQFHDSPTAGGSPERGRRPRHAPTTLAGMVPVSPAGIRATPALWDRLMALAAVHHPAISEFSWSTLHLWCDAGHCRPFRIGQFLVVPLGKAPDHMMVVAMPGAEVATPAVRARLAELMTTYELRYLPEQTAAILEPVVHEVGGTLVRVRDDADYFYDAQQLAALHGARGKAARRFEHRIEPSRVVIREGLLSDRWAFEHLLETQAVWAEKFAGHPPASIEQERRGIETWPRAAHGQRLRVFCLSVDGRPTGVSVVEPMYGSTWMGLVFKADPTVAGSAEFLRQHVAQQALLSLGSHGLICLQQDDGVLALRAMKESYRPKFMRDKLAVVLPGRTPSFPRVDAC